MSILTEVRIMTLRLPLILSVLAMLGACMPTAHSDSRAGPTPTQEGQHVPGELLVQFRPHTSRERATEILSANGLRIERDLGMPRAYLVKSVDASPISEIIVRLRNYPEVESAEPNRMRWLGPPVKPISAKPAPNG